MKVLITGGLGYLGGRLTQFLETQSDYEIVLGTRQEIELSQWQQHAQVRQIQWNSANCLHNVCEGINIVVHTAGMNAQDCAADPIAAFEFNAVATARLLQAAIQQGVKRFIYFSTAHVYKSPLVGIFTEETCPVALHPYATSHRAGEDLVRAAHQRGEIEGVVVRLSNAFGAPANKTANCWMLLVNDLCRQIVETQRIVLRTPGLQRRDFVPIRDVCHAINHLMHIPKYSLGKGLFNIGGMWSPTVWEMSCLIQKRCEKLLGFKPEINRPSSQSDEYPDEFNYHINTLLNTGFQLNSDRVDEIDNLLIFCNTSFSRH